MEAPITEPEAEQPKVVFRGKKRKAYRQRTETDDTASPRPDEAPSSSKPADDDAPTTSASANPSTPKDEASATGQNDEEGEGGTSEGLSVAEVLRRRNARKSKLKGVRFGPPGDGAGVAPSGGDDDEDDLSLMIREEEKRVQEAPSAASAGGTNARFAPQTGMVAELVNKHMEEYIEAELARKRASASASGGQGESTGTGDSSSQLLPNSSSSNPYANSSKLSSNPSSSTRPRPEKHIAVEGKLVEVDLGQEMRNRNVAMTERARRKLEGGEDEEDDSGGGPPAKVRLGKDGKPWQPRNRRGSDAVKRDQIVEEFLAENRFTDVYEAPPDQAEPEFEGSADDRIAEQFRREFMDAMNMRRQRRRNMADSARQRPKVRREEEILRGPKLGGSRNERAAMRDILLKQQADRKKAG